MIDAHIHLEQYSEVEERIAAWQRSGVEQVVAVSSDLASSYRTLELKEQFPDFILAGCGFHPEQPLPDKAEWEEWKHLVRLERENISCIGEIGLPHYELENLAAPLAAYQEFLAECVVTAKELEFPVALHAVHDKAALVFEILQSNAPDVLAHFHWLKAPPEVVTKITGAGCMVSVTPEVCYRERDQRLAAMIPNKQLLLETDGPWSFEGPFAGQETSPLFLDTMLDFLAKDRKVTKEILGSTIKENVRYLYK